MGSQFEGAFIFGLDYDDETVFERTWNFAEEVQGWKEPSLVF